MSIILRTSNSPYGDATKGSVLSQSELDGNFISLKGDVIYTAETSGSLVTLKKYNGNDIVFTAGSGSSNTVNNGLIENPTGNFRWGGTLVQNTTITANLFDILFTGTKPSKNTYVQTIQNTLGGSGLRISVTGNGHGGRFTTTGGEGLIGETDSGDGVYALANTTGTALLAESLSGCAIEAQSFTDIVFKLNSGGSSAINTILTLTKAGVSGGVNGGLAVDFKMVNASSAEILTSKIASVFTDPTNLNEDAEIQIHTINNGVIGKVASLKSNGQLQLDKYGVNTFSGIATYALGVDASGNIVEFTPSGGGSGTFSGGTVTGPSIFTNGLTANTISATTYQNLPIDIRITGGTYSNGLITFRNNTGGTFNVSGLTNINGDVFFTSGSSGTNSIKANNGTGLNASANYSFAQGDGTIASGNSSHAQGRLTVAGGIFSHSEGELTKALGSASHAEGKNTTASGDTSHAEGHTTFALGEASHAEGWSATSSGFVSHVEGSGSTASGSFSHAQNLLTLARGSASHAQGVLTKARGEGSHAEGFLNESNGDYSHSEGDNNQANGTSAHVEGTSNFSNGTASHAGGIFCTANGEYSFVHGEESVAESTNTIVFGSKITGTTQNTVYVPDLVIKKFSSVPTNSSDTIGEDGSVTWDNNFFYWKSNNTWKRISGSTF